MQIKKEWIAMMVIVLMMFATIGAAYATITGNNSAGADRAGVVNLSGHLVQEKIYLHGDGIFELNLALDAAQTTHDLHPTEKTVDIVLVLDRSGSMQGLKMQYAKKAILNLIGLLSPQDRLSLVSYADDVRRHCRLVRLTNSNRRMLRSMVNTIYAGGSTNLGGGLRTGIDTIMQTPQGTRIRKVILISDGLANRGIVNPWELGRMASIALENDFAVATVGVGDSFNEQLMAHIADQGAGTYHYMENPDAFAAVFEHEFMTSRQVAATSLEVHIPKIQGVRLLSAGGFPMKVFADHYTVYPGNLLSGQKRTLFLRFQATTATSEACTLKGIWISYVSQGTLFREPLHKPFTVVWAQDEGEVLSSIDKEAWEEKVLQEDYNRLREAVAADVKAGNQNDAIKKIETYVQEKRALNDKVQSKQVDKNLKEDVADLKGMVRETFQGSPAAVMQKQKSNAKSLQYEGYKERRDKN
jgi:Ca-activated chloride channel family protein